MQWEQLTGSDFAAAVQETGICVVSFGVLEKHSEHLPLGTDYLAGHAIACRAAEREPAVVFPPFYFGQVNCARCFPGAVTIEPALLVRLVQNVFDEIGRNGFTKIIAHNAHGGNTHFLKFLLQCTLWEEKPYCVYMPEFPWSGDDEAWQAVRETTYGGHGCEWETSQFLGLRPDLVKMERVPDEPAPPLDRLQDLPPTFTGIWWYADHPEHYAGDARTASVEKGEAAANAAIERLARYIAAVKADEVVPALNAEFFRRERGIRGSRD